MLTMLFFHTVLFDAFQGIWMSYYIFINQINHRSSTTGSTWSGGGLEGSTRYECYQIAMNIENNFLKNMKSKDQNLPNQINESSR